MKQKISNFPSLRDAIRGWEVHLSIENAIEWSEPLYREDGPNQITFECGGGWCSPFYRTFESADPESQYLLTLRGSNDWRLTRSTGITYVGQDKRGGFLDVSRLFDTTITELAVYYAGRVVEEPGYEEVPPVRVRHSNNTTWLDLRILHSRAPVVLEESSGVIVERGHTMAQWHYRESGLVIKAPVNIPNTTRGPCRISDWHGEGGSLVLEDVDLLTYERGYHHGHAVVLNRCTRPVTPIETIARNGVWSAYGQPVVDGDHVPVDWSDQREKLEV